MRAALLLIGLFGGCATTPLADLYSEHARCVNAGAAGCEVIWAEIERRERAIARNRVETHCPARLVDLHDDWGHRACVSDSELYRLIGRY